MFRRESAKHIVNGTWAVTGVARQCEVERMLGMAKDVDVIIIGFGPAGEVAASLISQSGHRVLAIDKAPAPYGQPRMSAIDGEIARVLQHAADPKEAMSDAIPSKFLLQFGADGEPLPTVRHDYKICGHWRSYASHQPHIEAAMERRIAESPSAEYRWGWRATRITQDADGAEVTIESAADPEQREIVRARYVLGFDGASSFVRDEVGIELDVLHQHDDEWILTDFQAKHPLPEIVMTAQFRMDPARPWFACANGSTKCRTDIRVMPGENLKEELANEDHAFEFMEQHFGLTRDDISIIRRVGYRFRSQIARRFRNGRVFIGGDAAHAMPPFMAQGACSAMRDAANIAWKMRLVLSGTADESLLDTYEAERIPHSAFFVHGSLATLRFVSETDPVKAAERDAAVRGGHVKFPDFPGLEHGIVYRTPTGELAPHAGRLAPQGIVRINGEEGLIDDLVGYGPQLISRLPVTDILDGEQLARLKQLGTRIVHVSDDESGDAVDVDGTYRDFWDATGASTLLSRPDVYLFGVADSEREIGDLVDAFLRAVPPPAAAHAEPVPAMA